MRRFFLVAILLAAFAAPLAAAHAASDPARTQKLDQLFVDLKGAKSDSEGRAIEEQIVALWLQSGDAKIDQQMESAITAMDTGSFDLALLYLNSIILNAPEYVEGWNKRATLNYFAGRFDESLADIDRTLQLEPRHFGALAGRGLVYEELGLDEKALAAFKAALAIDPQLTDILLEVFRLEDKLKGKRA
jgi:tetratricopeptide (TPR) repeat protein